MDVSVKYKLFSYRKCGGIEGINIETLLNIDLHNRRSERTSIFSTISKFSSYYVILSLFLVAHFHGNVKRSD